MQTMDNNKTLHVRISEATTIATNVRMLQLRADGPDQKLPNFTPGAHIGVSVQLEGGKKDWRQYSLIEMSHRDVSVTPPEVYLIAIRLDENGRGGSRYIHEALNIGDVIEITPPRNDFPMRDSGSRAFLIAGGIGVTPLATMAAACRFQGREVKMVYAGRDRASMALIDELQALLSDQLFVHTDTEVGAPLDISRLFDQFDERDDIHICGPKPLLDAMIAEAERRGWARDRLNFELFAAAATAEGDIAFDIILTNSERTLHVPVGKSILDVLIDEGCDPLYDCKRGECGVCATAVLSGVVDHRDYVLTASERAANNMMYPCVSRSKRALLVLDL